MSIALEPFLFASRAFQMMILQQIKNGKVEIRKFSS
jgi:hypothetical protein